MPSKPRARTCSSASMAGSSCGRTCGCTARGIAIDRARRGGARPGGRGSCWRCRGRSRSASTPRSSSCSSSGPPCCIRPCRGSGRTCSRRTSMPRKRIADSAPPSGPASTSRSPCSTSGRSPASATSTRTRCSGSSGCSPFLPVRDVDDQTLERLVATARRLLLANVDARGGPERVTTAGDRGAPGPLFVYGRAGRPCRRCRTPIRVTRQGTDLPRSTYWCPTCQGGAQRSPSA